MLNTPHITRVLLNAYCWPDGNKSMPSEATSESLQYLYNNGLIDRSDELAGTTPKGEFFIKHILSVPFPVETYVIPGQE